MMQDLVKNVVEKNRIIEKMQRERGNQKLAVYEKETAKTWAKNEKQVQQIKEFLDKNEIVPLTQEIQKSVQKQRESLRESEAELRSRIQTLESIIRQKHSSIHDIDVSFQSFVQSHSDDSQESLQENPLKDLVNDDKTHEDQSVFDNSFGVPVQNPGDTDSNSSIPIISSLHRRVFSDEAQHL